MKSTGIGKLFKDVRRFGTFFFGDKPERILIKADDTHYVAPEGRRKAHPHVLVFEKPLTKNRKKTKMDDDILRSLVSILFSILGLIILIVLFVQAAKFGL